MKELKVYNVGIFDKDGNSREMEIVLTDEVAAVLRYMKTSFDIDMGEDDPCFGIFESARFMA